MKKLTLGLLLLPALSIITLNATCPGGCPVMSQNYESYDDYQDMSYMGHQMDMGHMGHQQFEMDEFQQPMMHPLFELWMTLKRKVHRLKALIQHIDEVKQKAKENRHKMKMSKEQHDKKMQLWDSFKKHIKEAASNLKEIHTIMKKHMSEMRSKMNGAPRKSVAVKQKPMSSKEEEVSEVDVDVETDTSMQA